MSCRICLEALNEPASLPCGHIFCTHCIVKSVQAVTPYTHIHPCPICRLPYNIAPLDIANVPSHLRPFVTPSVRKVFLNTQPEIKDGSKSPSSSHSSMTTTQSNTCQPPPPSSAPSTATAAARSFDTSSEIARLRAENAALRNHCSLWRRRAEIHGAANLGLLKFAKALRDQMVNISRDRDELEKRCYSLKRSLDGDCDFDTEMTRYRRSNWSSTTSCKQSPTVDRGTLTPSPPEHCASSESVETCVGSATKRAHVEEQAHKSDSPRKRLRLDDLLVSADDVGVTFPPVDCPDLVPNFLDSRRRSV